jgi:hypothetical protein
MSTTKPTNPLVTLHLQTLVKDILGGHHYVTVSEETATVILAHTNNAHTCHVQFTSDLDVDLYGRFIKEPVLWEYGAWVNSSERVLKARLWSQRNREKRHILEANILVVAKQLCRFSAIEFEACKLVARKWLLNNDPRIYAIGVKRIYNTIEELP